LFVCLFVAAVQIFSYFWWWVLSQFQLWGCLKSLDHQLSFELRAWDVWKRWSLEELLRLSALGRGSEGFWCRKRSIRLVKKKK
jgi:hypothetical protein